MEDLPRNIRRNIRASNAGSRTKRDEHWTLLFVGTQGKVFPLGNAKGLIILLSLVLAVSLGAAAAAYLLYRDALAENAGLSDVLRASQEQIAPLKDQKDILMAQLSIAEAKVEVLRSEKQRILGKSPGKKASSDGRPSQAQTDGGAAPQAREHPSTAIEQFKVFHDPESNDLEVVFRLMNILESREPVSGFIFVVFGKGKATDGYLSLPAVNLASGRPEDIDRGQYFIISNYNDIHFRTTVDESPEQYQVATVFVFEKTGELLLQQDFPVVIAGLPPVPVE